MTEDADNHSDKHQNKILRAAISWFGRVLTLFLSILIAGCVFSNWRMFPSFSLEPVSRFWVQILIFSVYVGIFLLPAARFAAFLLAKMGITNARLTTDLIASLGYYSLPILHRVIFPAGEGFSFGVSEGEIIQKGTVTELGRTFFFMTDMRRLLEASVYFLLRFSAYLIYDRQKNRAPN